MAKIPCPDEPQIEKHFDVDKKVFHYTIKGLSPIQLSLFRASLYNLRETKKVDGRVVAPFEPTHDEVAMAAKLFPIIKEALVVKPRPPIKEKP